MAEETPSTSQEQRTPIRKLTPRTIHSEGRKIISQVANCCDMEKDNKELLFPLNMSLKRAAAYTGKSVATIKRIKKFSTSNPGKSPSTPGKKR